MFLIYGWVSDLWLGLNRDKVHAIHTFCLYQHYYTLRIVEIFSTVVVPWTELMKRYVCSKAVVTFQEVPVLRWEGVIAGDGWGSLGCLPEGPVGCFVFQGEKKGKKMSYNTVL